MTAPGLKTNAASPSGAEADGRAYAAMVARAAALAPRLRESARSSEQLRCLAEETERELHESGLVPDRAAQTRRRF